MKNLFLVTGWENTEHRLYHKKENAIKDFEEMLSDEGLGLDGVNPLTVTEITKEEYEDDELFYMAFAVDELGEQYWAVVEIIEFED